jgi:serine/threonine-protein kinase
VSTLYLGTDPKVGRKVAIKALALGRDFEGQELEELQRRFFDEAEAIGRLTHPHVVEVFDSGEEGDMVYIVMGYMKGESLDSYTNSDYLLPVEEVLTIGGQLAAALDYAHGRQVIHRDVKPSNVIYSRDKMLAKITDFGIARLTDKSRTGTGTVLGSPSYMSPEQVAGRKVDSRTDVYSLGVTLYQLLTGWLPFVSESIVEIMIQITKEEPRDIATLRSDLATDVCAVVHKALQKDPGERFQSAAEMEEAMRSYRTASARTV